MSDTELAFLAVLIALPVQAGLAWLAWIVFRAWVRLHFRDNIKAARDAGEKSIYDGV